MKSMRLMSFSLVFFLIATAFNHPPKDIKLEYKFKVGDVYEWTQVTKQTIKQTIGGGEMVIDMAVDGVMRLKVTELTPNGAKVETSFPKVKMVTKSPMGEVALDSDGPQDNAQNKMMKAMTVNSVFVFMTKAGAVEKVEGTEKLFSGLSELGLDEAALAQAKQTMEQMLGEKSIKANIEMAMVRYPAEKVKVGDTWKSSTEAAMNFPMVYDNTSSLINIEGTTASIDSDANISTTDKEKVISLNGFKAKSDLSGRQMSKSKINVSTGWPSELKVLSEIKGKMVLLAGGPIPEDMDVPMEITSESTFTIAKK
ncbi:MAG TPA: DUF6263 family protein [Ohtaekwangia sp.]|nr:DUF6263 family protein [Ohtaekwangia sp.]